MAGSQPLGSRPLARNKAPQTVCCAADCELRRPKSSQRAPLVHLNSVHFLLFSCSFLQLLAASCSSECSFQRPDQWAARQRQSPLTSGRQSSRATRQEASYSSSCVIGGGGQTAPPFGHLGTICGLEFGERRWKISRIVHAEQVFVPALCSHSPAGYTPHQVSNKSSPVVALYRPAGGQKETQLRAEWTSGRRKSGRRL